MGSLDTRLRRVEQELKPDEVVFDPAQEARRQNAIEARASLAVTMSPEHWQLVIDNMKALDDGETVRRDDLTINFLARAARFVKGDARPLTLPPDVASLYLLKLPLIETLHRECLSCGYDVKDLLSMPRFSLCPICGGGYEPIEPGEGVRFTKFYKGWSKANPGKSVDVYIPATGGLSW